MSLKDDLKDEVSQIFKTAWSTRAGQVIPSDSSVNLGNDSVKIDATVLYADMSGSTHLVDTKKAFFAAEVYKAYLKCAAKIIRSEKGEITAYDGDRIMAVFIGGSKNTSAVRAALKINHARQFIVNPAITAQYGSGAYEVKHTIGIDTSELLVAKTGIRGSNDLVWVGRAANHAAKLCSLPNTHPTRITEDVYNMLHKDTKFTDGKSMWESMSWNSMNGKSIYRSNWRWGKY